MGCRIPFPGFESFRFCISLSQYGEKERHLLKNLCFLLGAKFTDKAYKGVTHLICKFASGLKYEVYSKRGTPTITSEWLYECVKQVFVFIHSVEHIRLPLPLTIACEHEMVNKMANCPCRINFSLLITFSQNHLHHRIKMLIRALPANIPHRLPDLIPLSCLVVVK